MPQPLFGDSRQTSFLLLLPPIPARTLQTNPNTRQDARKPKIGPIPARLKSPFFLGKTHKFRYSHREKKTEEKTILLHLPTLLLSLLSETSPEIARSSPTETSPGIFLRKPRKKVCAPKKFIRKKTSAFRHGFLGSMPQIAEISTSFFDVVPGSDTQTKERHPGQQFSQKA